ncbi:MAG: hypothetical protein L6R41_000302 [Letrouitia leprolyta]|nr:MAG: hypothetical protein L6R41_000302 [Letrouitia leprolyta]
MAGFDWKNQRGSDGTVFVRALRSLGTVNLPRILPDIESGIADQIGHALKASGHNDAQNKALLEAAAEVADEVFIGAEFFRLFPESIAGLINKILSQNHRQARGMFDMLLPIIEERRRRRKSESFFAAATYAVLDLYAHAEDIDPLREELQGSAFTEFMAIGQGLPLMDSFIQESMRLSMSDSSKQSFFTS